MVISGEFPGSSAGLGLHTSTAGGTGSIPGQGTRFRVLDAAKAIIIII